MRVGESTKAANIARRPVNLMERLRSVLGALGITVVDNGEDGEEDITRSTDFAIATKRKQHQKPKRRVSFDDARLDETWLSEHSQPVNPPARATPSSLLSLPPRRGRDAKGGRRTRSTSSQRNLPIPSAAPKHFQNLSTDSASETDHHINHTLYFEPSQTQLEQNAEAFLSTSAIRSARQALHAWYDNALQRQQARVQAYSTATAHDRRTLLKQALDQLSAAFSIKRHQQDHERRFQRLEQRAEKFERERLFRKALTHWDACCADERLKTKVAKHHVLKVTYFKRWRAIASDNQIKVRRILVRKHIAVWRDKTARRLLWQEHAVAHYEETLMRSCKTTWFWHFCSRRVEGWHEQWIEKRAIRRLSDVLGRQQEQEHRGETTYQSLLSKRVMHCLRARLQQRQQAYARAQQHHDEIVERGCLITLRIRSKLAPKEQSLAYKIDLNLRRKAFRVWHLHLSLSRQATEIERQRILQIAWTSWNDALRCKALAQKIDERVLFENLYKWVLQERLKLFHRTVDGRLLSRSLQWWLAKVRQGRDQLANAEVVFAERQRRRRMSLAMLRLNIIMRNREDAERAAVEMANSRALPKVLDAWKGRTDLARQLAKWATDARFYCLCSSTLKVWKERTTEHRQNRRRDAYARVRARVKFSLVGQCFMRWRNATIEVRSMDEEAERRAQGRLAEVGTSAIDRWRAKSAEYADLDVQATDLYQTRLLGSAISAIVLRRENLARMDQEAFEFRRANDLALLAGALKRVQWATFTITRKVESAEALWARNRDQHIKHMLRHWASQMAAKKALTRGDAMDENEEEPESPSIRPASRAASRSADRAPLSSPPLCDTRNTTPGYMRTPSRSRRAGRFRPLPTPAPFTPMALDSAYLATTPAPLPNTADAEIDFSAGDTTSLTPQVTPFSRKLRAGGFTPAPPSALRTTVFGRSVQGGTNKSVRFAGASRFRSSRGERHDKNS